MVRVSSSKSDPNSNIGTPLSLEIMRFQEKYEDFQIHLPSLYTERKLKERSQNSFLTSLFSNKRESVDRDNLFEGSGYSKSRSNNTVQNLDPSVLEQSVSATGKISLRT